MIKPLIKHLKPACLAFPLFFLFGPAFLTNTAADEKTAPYVLLARLHDHPEIYDKKMLWTDGDVIEAKSYAEVKEYYRLLVRQYCAREDCGRFDMEYFDLFSYGKLPFKKGDKVSVYGKYYARKIFGDKTYMYWMDAVIVKKVTQTHYDKVAAARNK